MEICSLFVYGSLKAGFLRSSVWPHKPLSIREGVITAKLFDLGPYPAIELPAKVLSGEFNSDRDWVLGELWTLESKHIADTLIALDHVEGYIPNDPRNEYVRRVVSVRLDKMTSVDAYTYEYADRLQLANCRRIGPDVIFDNIPCAAWPDRLARVPKSFDEE